MDKDNMGASASRPGSRPVDGASEEASPPVGFDPSRVLARMREYLDAAIRQSLVPCRWHVSEPLLRDLSKDETRPASILGFPVVVHDEWAWGWMLSVSKSRNFPFGNEDFFTLPSVSDGGGQ